MAGIHGKPLPFLLPVFERKKDGTFVPEMIDYPTVEDGVEGVRFVQARLASSEAGSVWVDM